MCALSALSLYLFFFFFFWLYDYFKFWSEWIKGNMLILLQHKNWYLIGEHQNLLLKIYNLLSERSIWLWVRSKCFWCKTVQAERKDMKSTLQWRLLCGELPFVKVNGLFNGCKYPVTALLVHYNLLRKQILKSITFKSNEHTYCYEKKLVSLFSGPD